MGSKEPTPKDAARLLAFLPKFSAPDYKPIKRWGGGERGEDGTLTMPWPEYDTTAKSFFREAARPCWSDRDYDPIATGEILADESAVRNADLALIRSLLTYCVRGERFAEGHWGEMIEAGHIRRILERLAQLSGDNS